MTEEGQAKIIGMFNEVQERIEARKVSTLHSWESWSKGTIETFQGYNVGLSEAAKVVGSYCGDLMEEWRLESLSAQERESE